MALSAVTVEQVNGAFADWRRWRIGVTLRVRLTDFANAAAMVMSDTAAVRGRMAGITRLGAGAWLLGGLKNIVEIIISVAKVRL